MTALKFTFQKISGFLHVSHSAVQVSYGPALFHLDDVHGPLKDWLVATYGDKVKAIQESLRK